LSSPANTAVGLMIFTAGGSITTSSVGGVTEEVAGGDPLGWPGAPGIGKAPGCIGATAAPGGGGSGCD
jgi:hypothetical protein